MAVVQLSDAFIPNVYGSYTALDNTENSRFVQSGIIARSEFLDNVARAGGKTVQVPFWNDIDPTIEPNYSNDDPADLATPNKIGSGTMTARKSWLNQGFADMDLVQELAGSSPMQHIRNRFGTYWQRQMERRLIRISLGILADNVANDSSDMVKDISAEAGDAALFNSDVFIDAAYTMGDMAENIKAIAVHSMVMARMVKNDDIVFIPDSQGKLTIPTYKGRQVLVDDLMPVTSGVYTSILYGTGAFGFGGVDGSAFAYGEGTPRVPFEVFRTPRAGAGGGMEEIWERKTWLMHPAGFDWIEGTLTEFSPTLADLDDAAHWDRKVARKNVPMAFIKSKA